ncbi:FAD-dependent oxidoreductase [Clostridium sp. chh4-2]|uniref:FAD-dependent oxidoreductase n=1 Tax=Clostridium sp. chh4-2 TaxID=2067550 RepID=UPI000CCDAA21|nr:FAD-dependent oxidoreductase [Clostridium sp. chh4-2]PNV59525.1 FAD-dependent oxidoreductase [Clostridium sp. chh4-2]
MKQYIRETPAPSKNPPVRLHYEVVFVGGGLSGLCGAIGSARQGARTALIQDRSVFGGNASSETRMHVSGASCHWGKKDAAETGILMELQLENKYLNDSYNYSLWDGVLWAAAKECENLDIYMNTSMYKVNSDGKTIQSVLCYQMNTEICFEFTAEVFVDTTGNGTLGYFAGAEYCIGREAGCEYGEKDAPVQRDGETMGNTIYFVAEDKGHPVRFRKPEWAYTFDESDFVHRYHGDIVVYHDADDVVVLKPDEDYEDHQDQLVEKYDVESGYWWIELGGDWDDIIRQAEDIRYELYRTVYGVWDHIKNGGGHGAENYELVWVGSVAGSRESRRLMGDEVLTENDILTNRVFENGIAYGGWPMDEHTAGGFRAKGQIPSKVRSFPGFYSIPYGCYCSKTISNLMMAGRNISATKLAMGSARVMGTCAVGGEAVGIAAAGAAKLGMTPKEYGKTHIQELRQELLKNDLYIMGCRNEDKKDAARTAIISASSEKKGFEAGLVVSGVTRREGSCSNMWSSDGISSQGEFLRLKLLKPVPVKEVRLVLDPDLSEERCISVSKAFLDKEPLGVARELLKDYTVKFLMDGKTAADVEIRDNYQRLNRIVLQENVLTDTVEIRIHETNGCQDAHIYEIRIYGAETNE